MNSSSKRIWVVWLALLAAAFIVVLWLSLQIIELDRQREVDRNETEIARQEADLQNRISNAVYRMDLKLLPLVSAEAARPPSFYQEEGRSLANAAEQTPDDVLLYFQIDQNNKFTTFQIGQPQGKSNKQTKSVKEREAQVRELGCFEDISFRCSPQQLPPESQLANSVNIRNLSDSSLSNSAYGVVGSDFVQQQVQQVQQSLSVSDLKSLNDNVKLARQKKLGNQRGNRDYIKRGQAANQFTSQQLFNLNGLSPRPSQQEVGVMQPMWLGEHLVLARRVKLGKSPVVQCCWLNWPRIETTLKNEVVDLLPDLQVKPTEVDNAFDASRALTTVPAQLIVPELGAAVLSEDYTNSGLRLSLLVVWSGLLLAAAASGFLLRGVLALSERRANFVSAVTHELRTPLTTFRMYSEMLAGDMVPEQKRQTYANTLVAEADRLTYLVDNVLQYARLESGVTGSAVEQLTIGELLDRFSNRLSMRAESVGLKLTVNAVDVVRQQSVKTVPANVEQILFNLVDNACKYARPSSRDQIDLVATVINDRVKFSVQDYGPGVSSLEHRSLFKPFHKSTTDQTEPSSGVGLGLALCQRMAESLNGTITCVKSDEGARFELEFLCE